MPPPTRAHTVAHLIAFQVISKLIACHVELQAWTLLAQVANLHQLKVQNEQLELQLAEAVRRIIESPVHGSGSDAQGPSAGCAALRVEVSPRLDIPCI
jgi:hypothetical protein